MRAGEELALDSSATLRVAVEGRPAALHPVIRDEVYWIAREALANAFRHGEAEHVEIEIVFGSRELRVAAEIAYAKAVPAGRPKSWSRTADRLLDHHG